MAFLVSLSNTTPMAASQDLRMEVKKAEKYELMPYVFTVELIQPPLQWKASHNPGRCR